MNCVIKNKKNVYIRLNDDGKAVACTEQDKMLFEESKAKNIIDNLPKPLRKMRFSVELIPDSIIEKKERVIQKDDYTIPNEVSRWIEKFGICDDIIQEAKDRKAELINMLTNIDRELSNAIHKIELETSKNAYEGFLEYKKMKSILENRRIIKDELMIISNILRMDFRNFDGKTVEKAINGLANRKFTMRFVEGDENDIVQSV